MVLPSGWSVSHCVAFRFQSAQSFCFHRGAIGTARDSWQLAWVSETAGQLSASATRLRGARQWPAWLSPTRATVYPESEGRGPNAQAMGGFSGSHGSEGISSAREGLGETIFRSFGLEQR